MQGLCVPMGRGVHLPSIYIYIYIYICLTHENGFGKETTMISNFRNKWLFGVDAGGCTDKLWQFFCTCTVVFPPKWWSRLS